MWNRAEVGRLLRERKIRPNRKRGQNFLVDPNLLKAIARDAQVGYTDGVIEIGSGIGNLTAHLADRAGHVWAFEIDRKLHRLSMELLHDRDNVTIIQVDGGDFERHVDIRLVRGLKVVSNLPYSDWHRLLISLLSTELPIEHYTLMVQRDAFDRLRARRRTKEYGPDSVLVQSLCGLKLLRKVGRKLFLPVPRVDSALIRLSRREASMCTGYAWTRVSVLT